MARNTIKDRDATVAAFIAKGLAEAVIVPLTADDKFGIKVGSEYFVAKLDPKVKNAVKTYKTAYASEADLKAAMGIAVEVETVNPVKVIRDYCKQNRVHVSSHLYIDTFVLTHVTPTGRIWQNARVVSGTVELDTQAFTSRGAAMVRVEKQYGNRPSGELSSVPSYPAQLYFCG